MLAPRDLDALLDRMTIELLEATSTVEVLARVRREERDGVPAYDACPRTGVWRGLQPRDLVMTCAAPGCTNRYVWKARTAVRLYCSSLCAGRAFHARRRAA